MVPTIPQYYKKFFENYDEEFLAQSLIGYVVFDVRPQITPAIWQDVQIYIRFLREDIWSLSKQQKENADFALMLYRIKYIIKNMKREEIMTLLNTLFSEKNEHEDRQTITTLLEKQFHAPLDKLILTQERRVVMKDDLKNIDELFEFPTWLEYDEKATSLIIDRIMNDELNDEQIDYLLGATSTLDDYVKWLPAVKHVLMTTNNYHTFFIACDVLSIIWHAIPEEEKPQSWFRDEVFSIFWPRVNDPWPLFNRDKIDFEANDKSKILSESISWLYALDDLPDRIEGIDKRTFKSSFVSSAVNTKEIEKSSYIIEDTIKEGNNPKKILDLYFEAIERVETPEQLEILDETTKMVLKFLGDMNDAREVRDVISRVKKAHKFAKEYTAHVIREGKKLVKAYVK